MKLNRLALLTLIGAVACAPPTGESLPAPAAGSVVSFTAAPASVAPGDSVTLSWATKDATIVSVSEVGGAVISTDANGSAQVQPQRNTVYLVTAQGPGGTDARSTAVGVTGSQVTKPFFTALPATIDAGGSASLVWNAFGHTTVTLSEVGGNDIDIGAALQGSIAVKPNHTSSYHLTVDGEVLTATVTVRPLVAEFRLDGDAPKAGQPVKLVWRAGGTDKLTLTREGAATPLLVETDLAKIANGSFEDTAPADLVPNGVLTYRLQLDGSPKPAVATLSVYGGGTISITSFTVPAFVRPDVSYGVSWATSGAESLELTVDGVPVYRAQNQSTVDAGSFNIPAPAVSSVVTLTVRNRRGGQVAQSHTVATALPPTFVSFTSDKATIAQGGADTATLTWNVTNAHHVHIAEQGGGTIVDATGSVATGTVVVSPNRATTTYVLTADNGVAATGADAITQQTVVVTVTTPASLTFSGLVPAGGITTVTGTTITGATEVLGLPVAAKNVTGDAFVDIAATGTEIPYGTFIDGTARVANIGAFSTVIYGRRVEVPSISVHANGWFKFSATAINGTDDESTLTPITPGFGTALEPLAIAPYWRDLYLEQLDGSKLLWRVDVVNGQKRLIVQWEKAELWEVISSRLTFQAQVYENGKIVFAYKPFVNVATFDGAQGVVNSDESAALLTPTPFATTDVYTLFGAATLPAPIPADGSPYLTHVTGTGGASVEISANPTLAAGLFSITEVNPYPAAAVADGEWVEITNSSNQPVSLTGWALEFGAAPANRFAIPAGTTLPANGRLLFGQSAGAAETATVNVVYGNAPAFAMADTSGSVTLSYQSVPYSRVAWNTVTRGTSVAADAPSQQLLFASSTQKQLTCPGTGAYGTHGQLGTPGAANGHCFAYGYSAITANFESIIATGTALATEVSPSRDDTIYPLTLPTPVRIDGANVTVLSVSSNGFVSPVVTADSESGNLSVPSSTSNAHLAPFWDDLIIKNPMSGIYWQQKDPDGTPASGDEYTILSWENVALYTSAVTSSSLNFQVKFFANGNIEYHYGTFSSTGDTGQYVNGSSATSWFVNPTGDVAYGINVNSGAPGIVSNSAYRFTYAP